MGVGAGLYMFDVVVKSSRSQSHLLMSSCNLVDDRRLFVLMSVRHYACFYDVQLYLRTSFKHNRHSLIT